ncbi:hypothetical protein ABGB12_07310 [Actinocorallia sp. B10E7]|uniref:hypothetical protein n=1 Tax=Actinocorallia sp. B10E7 TaxID=3153558 RepID=UPI00325E0218
MSGTHRARSTQKKTPGKTLPAVIAAAVAVVAIGVAIFLIRPGEETADPASQNAPAAASTPETGTRLELTSTEDYSYSLGAIKADLDSEGHAYIEYLVTNTSGQTVPFEAPGQLFLPQEEAGTKVCADQEGTDAGLCSPPTKWEIAGFVGDTPPSPDGVDQYMPAGASFIVRVTTKSPVAESADVANFKLYVWDVRFTRNRIAQEIPLP